MIRNIFLPPLKSEWRLLNDVPVPPSLLGAYDELSTSVGVVIHPRGWPEWDDMLGWSKWKKPDEFDDARVRYHEWAKSAADGLFFPKGTVFAFDRYHVSSSGNEQITLRLVYSPDPRFATKKAGGTLKGKGLLYFTLADVNTLGDMDEVSDNVDDS